MNQNDQRIVDLLKRSVPPVSGKSPVRDLWPQVRARLHEDDLRFRWWDWLIAAACAASCALAPRAMLTLLYAF